MKKGKNVLFMAFLTLTFVKASSESLLVFEGGEKSSVDLEQIRKVCFVDGEMVVELLNGVNSSYVISGITKVIFSTSGERIETNVEPSVADVTCFLKYSTHSPNLLLVNCLAGEIIEIFSIDGKKVLSVKQSTDNGEIEIGQLPRDTYIIRVNDKSAKIIKL